MLLKAEVPRLHVAAGVLEDDDGRVLIAQRPADSHMGGAWEFPGGKIAESETPVQGLVRELHEELAVEVQYVRLLTRFTHTYPDRQVDLVFWKVLRWSGTPVGAEGQALQWVQPDQLMRSGLLPADRGIADLLQQAAPVNQCRAFPSGL